MRFLLYQMIPITVLLLPLLEATGFTLIWRRSLSSPWLYWIVGTVAAYAVAAGLVFVQEKIWPPKGTVFVSAAAVWRDDGHKPRQEQTPRTPRTDSGPSFAPLTSSWFALLATVLVVCGIALWGLKFLFRSTAA